MSDESKPGFLDGIMRGLSNKNEEQDSPQVQEIKEFIASKQLTNSERGDVAGWLLGDMARNMFADAFRDWPAE